MSGVGRAGGATPLPRPPRGAGRARRRTYRLAARLLGRALSGADDGELVLHWPDGASTRYGRAGDAGEARVALASLRALARLAVDGELGFARGYIDGDWTSEDLGALFDFALRNEAALARLARGSSAARVLNLRRHARNDNSVAGSRRNVARHYDLGNDFYRLWLDPSMSYSAALYERGDETLEEAQRAKLRRIAALLAPARGTRVLEIGCGWGALARHLAAEHGCRVTAVSLSRRQIDWARTRTEPAAAADGALRFLRRDYRALGGRFERLVSIEMFEAVGERYWPLWFERARARLGPGGRLVMQVITIDEARFERYRASPDFVQRHVFPGGMLPSRERLLAAARGAGFRLEQEQRFGASYALTLAAWRARFERALPELGALGFDARFVRLWRYYLAYCEAGFRYRRTDVGLYVFTR